MGRRIFLALLTVAALSCARPWAQGGAQGRQASADRVTVAEAKALLTGERPALVLDVRGHVERKVKGAAHIPLDQLESRLAELPRDREIITYCT